MNEETSNKIERKIDEMYRYMSPETMQYVITRCNCVDALYRTKDKRVKRTLGKICRWK